MREITISLKVSQDELNKIEELMDIFQMQKSQVIRFAVKTFYNEIRK